MTFNIACPVSKTAASHPSYANDPLNIVSEWPELVWGVNHTCCGVDCLFRAEPVDQSPCPWRTPGMR